MGKYKKPPLNTSRSIHKASDKNEILVCAIDDWDYDVKDAFDDKHSTGRKLINNFTITVTFSFLLSSHPETNHHAKKNLILLYIDFSFTGNQLTSADFFHPR